MCNISAIKSHTLEIPFSSGSVTKLTIDQNIITLHRICCKLVNYKGSTLQLLYVITILHTVKLHSVSALAAKEALVLNRS